ncbi:hypothetical protein [Microbacterium oleivorans]|uniref:hypothetical protein n=1 Tax=Microbacterium oleivorans TaxID=273677 RepID=UPI001FCEBE89|nr:hypothetical protein [Microbacterium oleivorans]
MGGRRADQHGALMLRAGRVWRALGATFLSGRYFTRWSLVLAIAVGVLLSVPSVGDASFEGYLRGVTVAALGSLPLIVIGFIGTWAERSLDRPAARAAAVIGTIVAIAGIRPFVNDAVSTLLFATSTGTNWASRIVTNLITCLAVFTVCALTITYQRQLHATTARLQLAAAQMRAGIAEVCRLQNEATRTRHRLVDDLRAARDQLLSRPLDFEAVRGYADRVRAASHALNGLRTAPAPDSLHAVRVGPTERMPFLGRLGTTPPLTVGLTYLAATLPFALTHGGLSVVLTAVVVNAALDLAAWALIRSTRRLRPRLRGSLFFATWLAVGVAVMGLTFALIPDVGSLGLVPLAGVPLIAVIISLCVDVYRRAHAEEQRATTVLLGSARRLAAEVDASQAPLDRATDLLHGRLQGRCVILAAHVDENVPEPEVIETFRAQTDDILDDVRSDDIDGEDEPEDIDDLVRAWSVVMGVSLAINADARDALTRAALGDAVSSLVNEGLVNAVKHSGARWAEIEIGRRGDRLHVRVASPGILAVVGPADNGRVTGIGTRGDGTTVRQQGDRVILEGAFAIPTANVATS